MDKLYEVEKQGSNISSKAYISDVAIISDGNKSSDKSISFILRDKLGQQFLVNLSPPVYKGCSGAKKRSLPETKVTNWTQTIKNIRKGSCLALYIGIY